jgi:LPS sulfotransferase NodH
MPKTRFLILCEARTGSNWLCGLLQSHPQILCHHEVFHAHEQFYAAGFRDGRLSRLGTLAERDADPFGFLERLWREDFGCDAVGFKLLAGQATAVREQLLGDQDVKKVLLRRRSRVRAYLSLLRAQETGCWSHASYGGLRVTIDPQRLLEFCTKYDEFYDSLRSSLDSRVTFEIDYEDLLAGPADLERLLEYLDVSPCARELRPFNARQSNNSLREAILNYEELCLALNGTELEVEMQADEG